MTKITKPKTSKPKTTKTKFSEVIFKKQIANYFSKNAVSNCPQKNLTVLAQNFLYDYPKYKEFYSQDQITELFQFQQNN